MTSLRRIAYPIILLACAAAARAQSGTLDQTSPISGAVYNGDASFLVWQAQVRAGSAGQLEGYTLELWGTPGASVQTAIRMGAGWNTTPAVFSALATKTIDGYESVFVDATSANIQLNAGSLFVIEMFGTGTGTNIQGSYEAPPNSPLYPEPLFLGGPVCYLDCGWRIAFRTWVVNGAVVPYCFGDGSGPACPCANNGSAGNGCASSVNPNGARLGGSGNASVTADTFVLTGSGMPNSSALYFQGTQRIGVSFGDGLRCASGSIIRLGTKSNTSGSSQYPAAGDPSISVRGAIPAGGGLRTYQCWYRNAANFCTAATFNLTNGVEITWGTRDEQTRLTGTFDDLFGACRDERRAPRAFAVGQPASTSRSPRSAIACAPAFGTRLP